MNRSLAMQVGLWALVGAAVAQTPSSTQTVAPVMVEGVAVHRERIAVPAKAHLVVTIERMVNGKPVMIGELHQRVGGRQTPFPFHLTLMGVNRNNLQNLWLRSEIRVDNRVILATPVAVRVTRERVGTILMRTVSATKPTDRPGTVAPVPDAWSEGKWTLVEMNGKPVTLARPPYLEFKLKDGKFTGFAGVNRFSGTMSLENEELMLDAGAMTMMAGDPAIMELETELVQMLSRVNRAEVRGSRLVLRRGDQVLAQFEPMPATAK